MKTVINRDFSIIFKEIEDFNMTDTSIVTNLVNEEERQQDESIRAFGEICRELNEIENNSTVFLTFS
jgi:hypothetical protein